jgi:hypothetical protein
MGWLFGGNNSKFNKPAPPPERKVIAFPKVIPAKPASQSEWTFEPMPWDSVDEVLWQARRDLRRGLIKADSVLIGLYSDEEGRIVWYQLGFSNEEVAAAFDEWREKL